MVVARDLVNPEAEDEKEAIISRLVAPRKVARTLPRPVLMQLPADLPVTDNRLRQQMENLTLQEKSETSPAIVVAKADTSP